MSYDPILISQNLGLTHGLLTVSPSSKSLNADGLGLQPLAHYKQ